MSLTLFVMNNSDRWTITWIYMSMNYFMNNFVNELLPKCLYVDELWYGMYMLKWYDDFMTLQLNGVYLWDYNVDVVIVVEVVRCCRCCCCCCCCRPCRWSCTLLLVLLLLISSSRRCHTLLLIKLLSPCILIKLGAYVMWMLIIQTHWFESLCSFRS